MLYIRGYMFNLNFYLSLISVLFPVAAGIYFLFYWFEAGRKDAFLLWWAIGFGLLFLFKIPNVLVNAGLSIVQVDLYPFLFIGLLLYLFAHFAFVRGLARIMPVMGERVMTGFFAVMFLGATIYFSFSFFAGFIGMARAPVWGSNVLFYIPIQIFIAYKLNSAMTAGLPESRAISHAGITFTLLGMFALVASSILYIIAQTHPYTLAFWYLAVVNTPIVSIAQILAVFLLFFGFRIFAKDAL